LLLNLRCNSSHDILTLGIRGVMAKLENQIREMLWQFAKGDKSFDDFLECFVPISCNIEQGGDDQAIQLAHHIDGILSEASSAHWDENDIREELARPFVADSFARDVVGDPSPFPVPQFAAHPVTNSAVAA
jgi:hypothetical protein